ncbi:MAG TPA: hypothetical protein VFK54_05825 [Candidatus Limnocylindrales bacterium]|nr:hypothetical protein [Candidatus Limnocylindrales bacterium]
MTDAHRRLGPVVRLAPAKLNLTLAVLGRREDGFHALHSVMVPLSLADQLSLAPAPPGGVDSLHRTGLDAGPIEHDLVLRAIRHAREALPRGPFGADPAPPVAARLDKRIPVAAGLGGGSSDAAAALDAVLELWAADVETERRAAIAAEIGSDVPFFLARGPALVEGRGERVTPLAWLRPGEEAPGVLLVTPAVRLPTPAVFAAYAAGHRAGGAARLASEHLAAELRDGRLGTRDLLARAAVLASANDLAAAADAVEPGLLPFRRSLVRVLARPVGLSGSGPTHWALYPSLDAARAASDALHAALAAGRLALPGDAPPAIHAVSILAAHGGPS